MGEKIKIFTFGQHTSKGRALPADAPSRAFFRRTESGARRSWTICKERSAFGETLRPCDKGVILRPDHPRGRAEESQLTKFRILLLSCAPEDSRSKTGSTGAQVEPTLRRLSLYFAKLKVAARIHLDISSRF